MSTMELRTLDLATLVAIATRQTMAGVVAEAAIGDINFELLRRRKVIDGEYNQVTTDKVMRHLEDKYVQLDWATAQVASASAKLRAGARA